MGTRMGTNKKEPLEQSGPEKRVDIKCQTKVVSNTMNTLNSQRKAVKEHNSNVILVDFSHLGNAQSRRLAKLAGERTITYPNGAIITGYNPKPGSGIDWPPTNPDGTVVAEYDIYETDAAEGCSSPSDDSGETLSMLRGVDVKTVSPSFFVHPYLPDGSLSILFGDPGTSKSLLVLWMLARISRGREIFGTETKPADVMMLSNEDPAGISMGRYLNSGGDPKRITLENFTGETFALEEVHKLKATIAKYSPKVVVIDSVMSHVGGKADVYRPNEVSALLSPLQAMAQEFNIVIIGLMHMNKQDAAKAIYRIGGSISFAGTARSAMYLDVKPDEPNMRVMCHVKANYSAHGPAQEIEVSSGADSIANLEWAGQSELSANDLLAKPDGETSGKKLSEAEDFLLDLLMEGGPLPSTEIYEAAEKREPKITKRTLERAKKTLEIESVKKLKDGKELWCWKLSDEK